MSFPDDLLKQAKALAKNETRRPKQASLRRAVSAAYYSLFHLLTEEASRQFCASRPPALRSKFRRAFNHSDMINVCKQFTQPGSWPAKLMPLLSPNPSADITIVAAAFVDLQKARHAADYDFAADFMRADVLGAIQKAENAFSAWDSFKASPNAHVFLMALLLNERWHK